MIVNTTPATESFTATLTEADGTATDVTADTSFGIDDTYGTFAGPTLTMSVAGKTQVIGTYTDKTANAQVIAQLNSVRVDPTLDPNTPALFGAPEDPSRAPTIVYPPADAVMPRNLGDFETHWTDASGNDVFEVSLHTEFADVVAYVPGGNGEAAAGTMPSYAEFLPTEWAAAVGNESAIEFTVRGIEKANPTSVGSAAPEMVQLSNEPMEGGLYYWATASTTGVYGIFRHDMANPGQPATEFMTTDQTSGRCVACHVLSRDGTKMAITYDGGDQPSTMIDVATATAQPNDPTIAWNFGTFTADGNEFISVEGGAMVVRKYVDRSVVTSVVTGGAVSHPDMSPDGTRLAYVRESGGADYSFNSGQIYTRTFDATTNTFGAETPLVTDGVNNYYPSWSPDGNWVLFNRADAVTTSYNNPDASLWVVKADGSAPPIQLSIANLAAGGLTNSWGRWAPFAQTLGGGTEAMFWITVSSKRTFGVRKQLGEDWPQIWMTPFFPDRASNNQDPTAPAFRLPFQDLDSKNHIAQWTERVVTVQ